MILKNKVESNCIELSENLVWFSYMQATKLNLDELFEFKKEQDLNTLKTYNLILERVHLNIKRTSRQKNDNQCCWF